MIDRINVKRKKKGFRWSGGASIINPDHIKFISTPSKIKNKTLINRYW